MVSDTNRFALRKLRVGLLGANGFIGSVLAQYLVAAGTQLLAFCGPSTSPRPIPEGIQSLTLDLTEGYDLARLFAGLDVIIHAAGPASVRRSFDLSEQHVRVHVEGTASMLRACCKAGVGHVIYLSSAEIYGRPEANPVSEVHRMQARSPYAAAKIGAEKMIEAYAESFGLKAVILRPFSIYGPSPAPESLLGTILTMARGQNVRLQDLRPIRDYCYVEDLAEAVLRTCTLKSNGSEIFNIGTGKGTSVGELARTVLREMGKDLAVTEQNTVARPPGSEIFELVADISRAQDVLEWNPEIKLEDGIRKLLFASEAIP